MGDEQGRRVHRCRVQSEERLQRRPVWRSICSADLGWEMLRRDSGGIDVHWESIVRRDLIRVGSKFNIEELVAGSKEHTAIVDEGLPDLHRYQTCDPSVCLRGSLCV